MEIKNNTLIIILKIERYIEYMLTILWENFKNLTNLSFTCILSNIEAKTQIL